MTFTKSWDNIYMVYLLINIILEFNLFLVFDSSKRKSTKYNKMGFD